LIGRATAAGPQVRRGGSQGGGDTNGRAEMTAIHDLEANKQLARRFFEAINTCSLAELDTLLHPDFVWNTAVVADDAPNELRPLQSNRLRGTNLPHPKPRLDRAESMAFFADFFGQRSGGAMRGLGEAPDLGGLQAEADHGHMHVTILGMTAEADRVAIEATSTGIANPTSGRRYGNFYHILMKVRDGQILLYKEYQDTLHVYDYTAD
jgi:ketosteroid isomerase-like protein